jgi:hypothetical protein
VTDLVFLLSADIDIQSAYEFYESSQEGRGRVFMRHLDCPLGGSSHFRRSHLSFASHTGACWCTDSYGIFYTIEGHRIVISGVMDLRQDPSKIRQRLS